MYTVLHVNVTHAHDALYLGPVSQKFLSLLVILRMEKTTVAKVISELISTGTFLDLRSFQKLMGKKMVAKVNSKLKYISGL